MARHGGSYERTRKHRKRRGRNGQSYHDLVANGSVVPQSRQKKRTTKRRAAGADGETNDTQE